MVVQGSSDINLKGARSKKKKLDEYNNWRPWPDLPEPMLDLITKSLGPIDYLMFGCVCRTWRSYVATYKKGFLASQPPLVLFLSTHARRACYFYSIFDRKLYLANHVWGSLVDIWSWRTRKEGQILKFGFWILLQDMNSVSLALLKLIVTSSLLL